ncbi:hypothetical protein BLA29_010275, partial [Euroglyphus maynei]
MEGSNPLLPPQSSTTSAFGIGAGTGSSASNGTLSRLGGRPLPGPFAHFASPIAPYTMPSFMATGLGAQQQQQSATAVAAAAAAMAANHPAHQAMFPNDHSFQSTLASMAAYSFDSLLSANFNQFANLLMMNPTMASHHHQNAAAAAAAAAALGLQPPSALLGAAFAAAASNSSTSLT